MWVQREGVDGERKMRGWSERVVERGVRERRKVGVVYQVSCQCKEKTTHAFK